MSTVARRWILAVAGAAVQAAVMGCSLSLDFSRIGSDAGAVDATAEATARPDASTALRPDRSADATPDADGSGGSCLCDAGPCQWATCDPISGRCSPGRSFGFSAGRFAVTAGGVGGLSASQSIAAVYPFVFVVSTNGVVAYDVSDPTSSAPPPVAVEGVPFVPAAVAAVRNRVFFVGAVQGNGPMYRQPIAWLDPPATPVASLRATPAWVTTTTSGLAGVLPGGTDVAYVVYDAGTLVATLQPPLSDLSRLTPASIMGLAPGASLVASSPPRLVAYRFDQNSYFPYFALVDSSGSAQAHAQAEQEVDSPVPFSAAAAFAGGDDGSVLWSGVALLVASDGTASTAAFVAWILPNAGATRFDGDAQVSLESYGVLPIQPQKDPTPAAPAWIDANRALALAAAAENPSTTSVQVADRLPLSLESGKRAVLSVQPSAVGAVASGGFGYVLTADDPKNLSATVHVYAPACPGGDR